MTNTYFTKVSIPSAMAIVVCIIVLGCSTSRSGLLVSKDAGSAGGSPGGTGGATTGAGGTIGGMAGAGRTGVTSVAGAGGSTIAAVSGDGGGLGTISTGAGGSTTGGAATGGTTPPGAPTVTDSGYLTVSAGTTVLVGYVSSFEGGSGSSITLTYTSTSFCASGTVGANSAYDSWAGAGFNVKQGQSGSSGSASSLVLSGTTISISYVNHAGSTLEFQLYDGSDYWCYELPPSATPTTKTIQFSSLNTQCWDNGGTPFVSGTPITVVELVAPGSGTVATPFDFCFLGLTVQ